MCIRDSGDIDSVLDPSLEMFAQQVKEADGDKEIEKAYYDAKAENVRTLETQRGQVRDMLANLDIPATMENIEAALNLSLIHIYIYDSQGFYTGTHGRCGSSDTYKKRMV